MKTQYALTVTLALGLIAAGCSKEAPAPAAAPAPAPAPKVEAPAPAPTNAPAEAPKVAAPAAAAKPATVKATEAKDHVGETTTVVGKVASVYVSKKDDIFISIGGSHPNAPFTAIAFHSSNIAADDLRKFTGKTVAVSGTIKEYNGQVEIIIDALDQITEHKE